LKMQEQEAQVKRVMGWFEANTKAPRFTWVDGAVVTTMLGGAVATGVVGGLIIGGVIAGTVLTGGILLGVCVFLGLGLCAWRWYRKKRMKEGQIPQFEPAAPPPEHHVNIAAKLAEITTGKTTTARPEGSAHAAQPSEVEPLLPPSSTPSMQRPTPSSTPSVQSPTPFSTPSVQKQTPQETRTCFSIRPGGTPGFLDVSFDAASLSSFDNLVTRAARTEAAEKRAKEAEDRLAARSTLYEVPIDNDNIDQKLLCPCQRAFFDCQLPCGHNFCSTCTNSMRACPVDRRVYDPKDVVRAPRRLGNA